MPTKENKIECPEYDWLVKGLESAKAKVKEEGKKAVASLFKVFFKLHPEVTGLGWKQYTPYFNDGDPCVFRMGDLYLTQKTGVDFAEVYSVESDEKNPVFVNVYEIKGALHEDLQCLARSIDNDVFEAAFGNDVTVIATPDGFHVHEYSNHN